MRVLNSSIILVFEHLEKSLKDNHDLRANQDYYIFKIKRILNEDKVKKTLLINGFVNLKLKNLIESYGLICGVKNHHIIQYIYKKGIFPESNEPYEFSFLKFYSQKAFNEDE